MSTDILDIEKKLLQEIREYTYNNKELLNAHHFMFACPVKKNNRPADIIICGLNPGGWWVQDYNQIRGGGAFGEYNKIFGEQKNITHTEAFFWNSSSLKKKDFDDRYGYSFYENSYS